MKPEDKIKDMLRKVASRKTEIAQLQGEEKQIEKQMKGVGCSSIEEVELEIEKEESRIENLEKEITAGISELEENYDWS